jgi:hypothetical protein
MEVTKLCELCRLISFEALGSHNGYSHHARYQTLQQEAEKKEGCRLCSLIWWSLRWDYVKLRRLSEWGCDTALGVLLFSSQAPHHTGPLEKIEIIIAETEKLKQRLWLGSGPYQLQVGAPDTDEVVRCELGLYGIYGMRNS